MNENKELQELAQEKGLNAYDLAVIVNGCGSSAFYDHIPTKVTSVLEPYFNLEFKTCCAIHDIRYYFGGDMADFHSANSKFYKCMKSIIKKEGYKKLDKTKWYQIKWSNVKTGIKNIIKVPKVTFLKYKAWQYYRLVEDLGKEAFYFNSGSGLKRLRPSDIPYKEESIRKQVVWVPSQERWYLRTTAKTLGLISIKY